MKEISVNGCPRFKTIFEAINYFVGTNYVVWRKACWPSSVGSDRTNFRIWCPKLASSEGGKARPAANDCVNILSDDWDELTYDDLKDRDFRERSFYTGYDIIIAKEPHNGPYVFRGVYILDTEKTDVKQGHFVSRRIGTRIRVAGIPAHTIDILDSHEKQTEIDIETVAMIQTDIDKLHLHGEDREAVVKVRVNQGKFREILLHRYSKCCLCGISDPNLLTASHIKPWSASESDEKLDVDNGFLLCPNHDKLFDKGLISFTDEGKIIISSSLSDTDRLFTNINPEIIIDLTEKNKEYLAYHRENVFKR